MNIVIVNEDVTNFIIYFFVGSGMYIWAKNIVWLVRHNTVRGRFRAWRRQLNCKHHWHPLRVGGWSCCWCEKGADGLPHSKTKSCRRVANPW